MGSIPTDLCIPHSADRTRERSREELALRAGWPANKNPFQGAIVFWAFMLIAGAILWYLLVQKAYTDSVSQNQTHNGEAAQTLEEAQPQWSRPGEAIARPEQPLMRQQEGSGLDSAQPEIGGASAQTPAAEEDSPAESRDAWESWDAMLYTSAARPVAASLRITFCDRAGAVTTRDITVERYFADEKGGAMIAYCHLRNARRPFVFSRVREAIDTETGEVIHDLVGWLDRVYEASPAGARDRFLQKHADALLCLFFVAKADGAFHAREKSVVREFCVAQGASNAALQEQLLDWTKDQPRMSKVAYGISLRAVAQQDRAYREAVLAAATKLAEATAGVHEEEAKALERMKREFKLG